MTVGCMFFASSFSASLTSSPAITTTLVVPSPTSSSWALAISTINLAIGCWTSISSSIVAPSFVTVMSPRVSISILSIPLGPREVLTASAIALATMMFMCIASLPVVLVVPSFSIKTGIPKPPACADIYHTSSPTHFIFRFYLCLF